VVATQILQMIRQLTPLVRFDGYHVLADLTGVPDLFQRIKPTLLGVLPWRWKHPDTLVLQPWARAVVTLWVLVVVPLLLMALLVMVLTLPRLLGTAWASLQEQSSQLSAAWGQAEVLDAAARIVAIIAVTFPILAIAVILVRLIRSTSGAVWTRTQGKPVRRVTAVLVAATLIAGVAWAWWPRADNYRPIQPWEGGTMGQLVSAAVPAAEPTDLVAGSRGQVVTAWAEGDPMPTEEAPELALILVPREAEGEDDLSVGDTAATTTATESPDGTDVDAADTAYPWVFPFDRPLEPDEGDNQALAVTTEDGAVAYDVAFALVWVEDDSPALNTNEAYAFANCSDCAAVAIGFQVVLVTGDNHVAVPQNLAAAVNNDCVNCLTYALARQLFVTLDGPLSADGMERLAQVWLEVAAFAERITEVPLSEIESTLTGFEQRILQIIDEEQGLPTADPALTPSPTTSSIPTATPSGSPTTGPSANTSASGNPTAEPSGTPSTTDDPTSSTSPTPSTTSSSTASPTGSPTASPSPSATAGSSSPSPTETP
jgi:putative peptide zinc metalloprotease protein